MKLDLGCGQRRREGFVGVDRHPCQGAAVLADVARALPFRDGSIDEIYMDNLVEHVPDIPALIREVVRVARPGARVVVITPHFSSWASWRDPTHVHHLSYFSFDHFAKPSARHYVGGGLRVVARRLSFPGGLLGLVGRLLFRLSPEGWEKRACFVFRASTLRFQLEVVK